MSFPNLALHTSDSELWADATGVPDNGPNTFQIPFALSPALGGAGIPPDKVDEDWLKIDVISLSADVSACVAGAPLLSADKLSMTLNFTQAGAGQCTVRVQLVHSLTR